MSAKLDLSVSNLEYNINQIRKKIKSSTKIIAMVKANAYGCGIKRTVKNLLKLGVDSFGVALLSEGIMVKKICKDANVIVTSQAISDEDLILALDNNISLSMSNIETLLRLNELARNKGILASVNIKVDTGMTRLGFKPDDVKNVLKQNYSNISFDGIYTHLSSADTDHNYTKKQLELFNSLIKDLAKDGYKFKFIHALNSAGVASSKYSEYEYTHVRIGLILYGYYPDKSMEKLLTLKPCMTLTAPIINIRTINKDSMISYSQTHQSPKGSIIATIQIGYADGLRRNLSNKYSVYYKGNLYNIVGNICMDMCMIDITSLKDKLPLLGEEVEIFGENIPVENMANILNTINYEILSCLNERIIRK